MTATANENGLGVLAEIHAGIGRIHSLLQDAELAQRQRHAYLWQQIHPVLPIGAVQIASGAGTLDAADAWGPKDAYWWDLHRITCWGFSAGTVTVYRNANPGEQICVFTAAGEFTWGKGQKFLAPRDHLIFVASGITGNVQLAVGATEVTAEFLPEYLG